MAKPDRKCNHACKPENAQEFDWDNSPGIAPPSETAKSLMDEEGYVKSAGKVQSDAGEVGGSGKISNADEFERGDRGK